MNLPNAEPLASAIVTPERRSHPRYTVNVQIEIHQDGSDIPMRLETTDLSRGGCYVQLLIPLSVSIPVHGTLWLDDCAVVFRGVVVTRHPQYGNGIMFLDFENQGERILQRYLDAIVT